MELLLFDTLRLKERTQTTFSEHTAADNDVHLNMAITTAFFLPGVLWPDQSGPADSCEAGEPGCL